MQILIKMIVLLNKCKREAKFTNLNFKHNRFAKYRKNDRSNKIKCEKHIMDRHPWLSEDSTPHWQAHHFKDKFRWLVAKITIISNLKFRLFSKVSPYPQCIQKHMKLELWLDSYVNSVLVSHSACTAYNESQQASHEFQVSTFKHLRSIHIQMTSVKKLVHAKIAQHALGEYVWSLIPSGGILLIEFSPGIYVTSSLFRTVRTLQKTSISILNRQCLLKPL